MIPMQPAHTPPPLGRVSDRPTTILVRLSQFGLLRFTGADAQSFLHGQLSCDVNSLQIGHAQYGCYNTPQGRMLGSFLLWRDNLGYLMQLPRELCAPIQRRLAMFVLRSQVNLTDASDQFGLLGVAGPGAGAAVVAHFRAAPPAPLTLTMAPDASLLKLAETPFLIAAPPAAAQVLQDKLAHSIALAPISAWNWHEIRTGIPWITPATQDLLVPQMANLDLVGGVSFTKGCYPGQEIVARLRYLGRLKQRMYLAHIPVEEPAAPGDRLYSTDFGDQACGIIVNAAAAPDGGQDVLASIQIASANCGSVHWKTPDGTMLTLLELPYKP